jgi:REP element-mobilizing transposase RayT
MARGARLDAPGVAHHVMVRGIERRRIFQNDEDRSDFLARLDRLLPEEEWGCFGWTLMPNHVHLVLQSVQGGLSRLMARLNTGYARGFNLRHDRSGYLFQNRFQSRIVCDDADLMSLVVYVYRNPLKACLVRSPDELETYPWCGLGALLGRRPARAFESTRACLSMFGADREAARRCLRRWIAGSEDEPGLDAATPRLAPGVEEAVAPVAARLDTGRLREIRITKAAESDPSDVVERVTDAVSRSLGASPDLAGAPGGRGLAAEIRSIVASIGVDQLHLRRREIGEHLGISPTAVSHAARRGRSLLQRRRLGVAIQFPDADEGQG